LFGIKWLQTPGADTEDVLNRALVLGRASFEAIEKTDPNKAFNILISPRIKGIIFMIYIHCCTTGFSPGPKGPLVSGCEPGLRFRD
jgi:hypothetical protein